MRTVILNWSKGENDPFSFFSRQWQRRLQSAGHEAHIIAMDDVAVATLMALCTQAPIDLAFCWQGVGSTLTPAGAAKTVWELLRIPLICFHADHPAYNPANHQQSSAYLVHIYGERSFADAANRIVVRDWPALHNLQPNLFERETELPEFSGDFFVLSKNIRELAELRAGWQARYDAPTYALMAHIAEAIEAAYFDGNVVNHHQVIVEHLPPAMRDNFRSESPLPIVVDFVVNLSRELDPVHRNVAATFIVEALPDTPIHIYGRGWDRYAARGNPQHRFLPAQTLEQSAHHYESNFGILDVAPANDMLHDRTFRAIQVGAGFLLSSSWYRRTPGRMKFADLFFGGKAEELARKVAAVQADPIAHRKRCETFGAQLHASMPSTSSFLEEIARQLEARSLR